ncbi:MAG: CAP domain-containing protein, partial [Waterburya sp.]
MSTELINQVVELTNVERTNAGLQPLKLDSQLVDAAQDHSNDMAQDDFFSHTGVDGSTPASRVTANGYEYSTTGENIAAGQTTAAGVVESWMNSPGHRANILNPDFTEIGIGYEYLENDTGSVKYNHYWT